MEKIQGPPMSPVARMISDVQGVRVIRTQISNRNGTVRQGRNRVKRKTWRDYLPKFPVPVSPAVRQSYFTAYAALPESKIRTQADQARADRREARFDRVVQVMLIATGKAQVDNERQVPKAKHNGNLIPGLPRKDIGLIFKRDFPGSCIQVQ